MLTLNDCLKQMNDRYSLFQTLWTMFFAVTFGLLVFFVNAKFGEQGNRNVARAVAIGGFLVFGVNNARGLRRVRNEYVAFAALARELLATEPAQGRVSAPMRPHLDRLAGSDLPSGPLIVAAYAVAWGCVSTLCVLLPLGAPVS